MGFGIAAGAAFTVGIPRLPKLLKKGLFIPEESHFGLRMGYEGDFVGDGQLKRTDGGSGRIDSDKQETDSGDGYIYSRRAVGRLWCLSDLPDPA